MCEHIFEGNADGVKCRICGLKLSAEEFIKQNNKAHTAANNGSKTGNKNSRRKAVNKDE